MEEEVLEEGKEEEEDQEDVGRRDERSDFDRIEPEIRRSKRSRHRLAVENVLNSVVVRIASSASGRSGGAHCFSGGS